MRYVQRDENGRVIGHFANPQLGYAEEELGDGHPDLLAYEASRVSPAPRKTDLDALRELLIEKAIITQAEIDAKRAEAKEIGALIR